MTPDTTVVFSPHALGRMRERGITGAVVDDTLRKPVATGHLPRKAGEADARYASRPQIVGGQHVWLTVVFAETNGVALVLTAYPGTPTRVRNATLHQARTA